MIKAFIIDDEQNAVDTLRLMLEKYCTEVQVVGTANGIGDLVNSQPNTPVDVVFLDINFGEYSGFDLLKKVNLESSDIVFVTAYDNYGIQAIKSGAFDYIQKPVDPEELIETVNKLLRKKLSLASAQTETSRSHIVIPVNNSHVRIHTDLITHVEADGTYSMVYENTKKYFCSKPLKHFETILPADQFFRVHHSFLVRIDQIKAVKMGRDQPLVLENGTKIPVARNRKKELMRLLNVQ